jgi:hypothetical protein
LYRRRRDLVHDIPRDATVLLLSPFWMSDGAQVNAKRLADIPTAPTSKLDVMSACLSALWGFQEDKLG